MRNRSLALGALMGSSLIALFVIALTLNVNAQTGTQPAGPDGREVTLTGRIVDLHCNMTGKMPSDDPVVCTKQCIRAGVPAALETAEGLIILGQGMQGPGKAVTPFAYQNVEIKGRLFEKNGLSYLDIEKVVARDKHDRNTDEEGME